MNQFQNMKYYFLAGATEFLFVQLHFWEGVDEWLKRGTMVAGICIGVFTAIKLYQDITTRALDNKLKRLDIDKKAEELRRMFEQEYRDK